MRAFGGVFSVRESYKAGMPKAHEERVNIEWAVLLAHSFHFLLAAGKACLFPFLTIYFRLLGLSASQVGVVFAMQAFIRLWCAPLWTACAKGCRKKKFVLLFSTFFLLASGLCLALVPPSNPDSSQLYCKGPLIQSSNGTLLQGIQDDNTTVGETGLVLFNASNTSYGKEGEFEVNQAVENEAEEPTQETEVEKPSEGTEVEEPNEETEVEEPSEATDLEESNEETEAEEPSNTEEEEPNDTEVQVEEPSEETEVEEPTTTTGSPTTTTTAKAEEGRPSKTDEEKVAEIAHQMALLGIKPQDLDGLTDEQISLLLSPLEGDDSTGYTEDDLDKDTFGYRDEDEDDDDDDWYTRRQKRTAEVVQASTSQSTWENLAEMWNEQVLAHRTFMIVLVLVMVSELLAAPVDKLADDCWFEYLDILDFAERYGAHRVWQMMGYILFPMIVGTIVEKTDCVLMNTVPHFIIHFFMFAAFGGIAFLLAFGYPMSQNKRTPKQSRFAKGVRILCCDVHSLTMTISILLLGTVYACIHNFLLWQIQDVGGSEIVLGASIAVAAVSAFFLHGVSSALIKRITHVGAIVLALITLAGRLVFYSFLWTPWVVLAGEVLHGFSYTLLWRAVEMYPDFRINPFLMDRSAFTLIHVIYHGLGFGFGSLVSGYLYDHFGFALLFQAASVLVAAWCALFLLIQKCVKKKAKVRYAKLLQDDRVDDDTSEDEDDWLEVAMKSGSK